MPDTRKGHNPSGAPDPTRARAENNIQKDEKRVHDLIHVSAVMWQMPQGLRLQSALS